MRIVIKDADFSQVSIGKVEKDLSFSFDSADGAAAIHAFFPNYINGTLSETEYYTVEDSVVVKASGTTANRMVSDFHEVKEGMSIKLEYLTGFGTSPSIIAFDEDYNILSDECVFNPDVIKTAVLGTGVKYVRFQGVSENAQLAQEGYVKIIANMPE